MTEFKTIETQEQLDAVIKDRIARAEKKIADGYADYEDLKKAKADYEEQIAALTEQLKAKEEAITGNDATLKDLQAKVREYEMASVRTRIAHDVGLPFEMANRLRGDDEGTIRADAEQMLSYIKTNNSIAPIGAAEADMSASDPHKSAMQNLLKDIERR